MPAAVHSATMVPLKPVPTQNRPPSPPPDDTLPRSTSTPFQPTHKRRGGGPLSSDGASRAPLLGMQVIQPAVARRQGGGKPLLEWISRKLGSRRASDAQDREAPPFARRNQPVQSSTFSHSARNEATATRFWRDRSEQPAQDTALEPYPTRVSVDAPSLADSQSMMSFGYRNPPSERRREANNPYPSLPIPLVRRSYPASTIDGDSRAPSMSMLSRSRTSSLRSLSSYARRHPVSIADDDSNASLYPRNADEDASLRPLPPSPTSMSIISRAGSVPLVRSDSVPHKTTPAPVMRRDTRSSSVDGPRSFMSDDAANLRGSREGSLASTKPTTIISFESGAPAHIAVAPSVSSSSPVVRPLSTSTGASGGGLAQSLPSPVSPTFLPANVPPEDFQVPKHTRYHPRNNPHPGSAPGPNAPPSAWTRRGPSRVRRRYESATRPQHTTRMAACSPNARDRCRAMQSPHTRSQQACARGATRAPTTTQACAPCAAGAAGRAASRDGAGSRARPDRAQVQGWTTFPSSAGGMRTSTTSCPRTARACTPGIAIGRLSRRGTTSRTSPRRSRPIRPEASRRPKQPKRPRQRRQRRPPSPRSPTRSRPPRRP